MHRSTAPIPTASRASSDTLRGQRVMIWALIQSRHRGSFEDYLLQLGQALLTAGAQLELHTGPCAERPLAEAFAAAGITWQQHSMAELGQPAELHAALDAFSPTLLHLHFFSPCSPLISKGAQHRGLSIVFSDHGSEPLPPSSQSSPLRVARQLRRRYYGRMLAAHIAVSRFVADRIRANDPAARPVLLPNGVDLERFRPDPERSQRARETLGIEPGRLVLGFIGQLSADKGADLVAELEHTLADLNPVIVMIGDGPLAAALSRSAGPGLKLLGRRSDNQELLAAMDVLLAPSRWHEAYGLAVAEAAASGVPVIASDRGGLPEIIDEQRSGWLFPAGDAAALQATVRQVVKDRDALHRCASAARELAEARMGLEQQIRQTVVLYTRLLQ